MNLEMTVNQLALAPKWLVFWCQMVLFGWIEGKVVLLFGRIPFLHVSDLAFPAMAETE